MRFTAEQFAPPGAGAAQSLSRQRRRASPRIAASGQKGMVGIAAAARADRRRSIRRAPADAAAAATWDRLFNRWPLDAAIKGIVRRRRAVGPERTRPGLRRLRQRPQGARRQHGRFPRRQLLFALLRPPQRRLSAGRRGERQYRQGPGLQRPGAARRAPRLLMRLRDEYGNPPVFITENGAGFGPKRRGHGRRHRQGSAARRLYRPPYRGDAARPRATAPTCAATWNGAPSTISSGSAASTRRFGMVHVDFDTQKRTPKQSFHTYRDIIARNRAAGV